MKAKKALGMALALASALFFFACSNMDSGSVDNGAAYLYTTQRTLTVNVNNVDLSDGSGTAVYDPWIQKTVMPETAYTTGELTLVLKYISNGKTQVIDYLTDDDPATPDEYKMTLNAGSYDFWLYAYVTASLTAGGASIPADAKALYAASDIGGGTTYTTAFWAHAAADLTNEGASVTFDLSPVDLKGKGTVKIAGGYLDKDLSVHSYRIGLYNIYTNEPVPDASAEPGVIAVDTTTLTSHNFVGFFGTSSTSGTVTVDGSGNATGVESVTNPATFTVPAGSYRAAVTFYQDETGSTEIGYWSDYVIVEPDNISEKTDVFFTGIKSVPKAPISLKASLVKSSFTEESETYDVILDWEDKSDNEKGFLIRVSSYTVDFATETQTRRDGVGTNTPADVVLGFVADTSLNNYVDGVANPITVTALLDSDFYTKNSVQNDSTPGFVENPLLSQCTEIRLTLKKGYLYDFEVCAYNALGCSKYAITDETETANRWASEDDIMDSYAVVPVATRSFDGWTPRMKTAGTQTFSARGTGPWKLEETMVYKMDKPDDAADPGWNDPGTAQAQGATVAGTDYYTKDDSSGTAKYTIAYISAFDGTTPYSTFTSGGTPYSPHHVNLYTIEFRINTQDNYDCVYYPGSGVKKNKSIFNHYRFGMDTPSFSKAFGPVAAGKMSATAPLTNPITVTDPTKAPTKDSPGSGTGAATTPFILQWKSNTVYYNWTKWYRFSSTADGTTKYYTDPDQTAPAAPVPADPLQLTLNNHAYGNQVVYAAYTGSDMNPLTIHVQVTGTVAGDDTYDMKDEYITASYSASQGFPTSGSTSFNWKTNDADGVPVDIAGKNYLVLKVAPTGGSWAYDAIRFEVNGRVQSSNVKTDGKECWINMASVQDGGKIYVLVGGYKEGHWYSRSFTLTVKGY